MSGHCPLCEAAGGELIHSTPRWRLIRATDTPAFPAFYRLVWQAHVAELSDLSPAERHECVEVLARVECVMREHLRPTKLNLAALGNMVPHLHWHLIARFDWDSHFPAPIWAPAQRDTATERLTALTGQLPALDSALQTAFH